MDKKKWTFIFYFNSKITPGHLGLRAKYQTKALTKHEFEKLLRNEMAMKQPTLVEVITPGFYK